MNKKAPGDFADFLASRRPYLAQLDVKTLLFESLAGVAHSRPYHAQPKQF